MLRSLFSAISGLQAHQTKLDVVGNNIANVNTVGFKSSTTVFEDTLSQVLRNGSSPDAETGGTNPAQVGLGVQVSGITTNWKQGSTQATGRSTDFLINGDGFFITKSGSEQLYTRAGSFDTDATGKLVTPDGSVLQGWMATNGVIDTNQPLQSLSIPIGSVMAPQMTTNNKLTGNLSADNPQTTQIQVQTYDSLGNAHQMSYVFAPDAGTPADPTATPPVAAVPAVPGRWTLTVRDENNAVLGSQTLDYSTTTGKLVPPATGHLAYSPTGTNWPAGASIDVDLTGVTQFGGKSTVSAVDPDSGKGSTLGTLTGFQLSGDGTVVGLYSNNMRQTIGQIALASFANPSGLEKAGNSSFRAGDNSGIPQVGRPGSGGRGDLTAGALEMSNVDLAQEFTGLIIAQRGFQANSKVITTSDEVLEQLVNLKR